MTTTEKEEVEVSLEDIIRKEIDEYPMIHEYSLVISRCCAVHFEDPGDCDCYVAGELVPTLVEAVISKLITKIEEAERKQREKLLNHIKELREPEIPFHELLEWWETNRGTDSQISNQGYEDALDDLESNLTNNN